jgi:hypothetical protein
MMYAVAESSIFIAGLSTEWILNPESMRAISGCHVLKVSMAKKN